jgi:hypothetical protein
MSHRLLIRRLAAATVLAMSIFSAQLVFAQEPDGNVHHAGKRSPHHTAHKSSPGCDQRCQESWARSMAR